MNRLTIIGNLTRDPETRVATNGKNVTSFTVAVNRRTQSDHPEADYVRVTAWDTLAQRCAQYLAKGRKVMVAGPVRAQGWTDQQGQARASLEMTAHDVEFLTSKREAEEGGASGGGAPAETVDEGSGMTQVDTEELPF